VYIPVGLDAQRGRTDGTSRAERCQVASTARRSTAGTPVESNE
jgi:hypothetical protein